FADHHGQPEPQGHETDGREGLQRAVSGREAEEAAVAAVDRGEHDDAGRQDNERPSMRAAESEAHAHRPLPRACNTMTASTISPAARYCHSWRNPLSSSMTCTAAITIAPANVRKADPWPPPIAVPPTSTAAMAS